MKHRLALARRVLVSVVDFTALFVLEVAAVIAAGIWLGDLAALALALVLPPLTFGLVAQRGAPDAPLELPNAVGASLMGAGAATLLGLVTADTLVRAATATPLAALAARHDHLGLLLLLPLAMVALATTAFLTTARFAPRCDTARHILWTLTAMALGTLLLGVGLAVDSEPRCGDAAATSLGASALVAAWCAAPWLTWLRSDRPTRH